MTQKTVLIVEDDPDISGLIRGRLDQLGISCLVAEDGPDALRLAREEIPALILLDLMLPHMDGLQVLAELQAGSDTVDIPVIILTARAAEDERVEGLRRGAVDYITKPFSIRELMQRVQNVLKLTRRFSEPVVTVGDMKLDLNRYRIYGGSTSANLTATEFKILWAMANHLGRVYSRDELLNRVWGSGVVLTDRTVDVHVKRLREKIKSCGLDPNIIGTVRGVGYRLAASAN
jgi:DNA-binding response OmpR family regulator